jgi:hypothetical protein
MTKVNEVAVERICEKWKGVCTYKKKERSKWTLNLFLFIFAVFNQRLRLTLE